MNDQLKRLVRRLRSTERTASVERRLRRERPRPDSRFAAGAYRTAFGRWAIMARPPRWRLTAIVLILAGLLLLVAAVAVAAS
jgi:hypothetical protein